MKIEARKHLKGDHFNITGGGLAPRKKFSIHESKNGTYTATAAKGNADLITYFDSHAALSNKHEFDKGYYGWAVDPNKVITVINAVIWEFEEE